MGQQQVIARLRDIGYRMTTQRRALLDAIWSFEGHFTVEMVRVKLATLAPSVDTSTIYRTLELLAGLGVIHSLAGSSPTEYERPGEPHHHLVCTGCGTVMPLADYHLDELFRHLLHEHGFRADLTHLAIPGYCAHCQSPSLRQGV